MPRDINGTYTLPGGINPVVPGTTIDTAWANPTMADIAAALTDSLSRTGLGGMTGAFRFADGSKPAPGIAWSNEPTMGFYRATTNDTRFAIANQDIIQITPTAVNFSIAGAVSATVATGYMRLQGALYMPNSSSVWMKDAAAADMPVLSSNVSNELVHGAGASWAAQYFFIAGVSKAVIDAASFTISTNLVVTGNATISGSAAIADGINAIGNNRSIYFKAADTTPYAAIGVDTVNSVNIGSTFPAIVFIAGAVERGRFNSAGAFKATTTGAYIGAATAMHELTTNNTGNYSVNVSNYAVGTPYGVDITFDAFPAGSRGFGNYYLDCRDTGGAVFAAASNGGLLNYSAFNTNLCDARAKRDIAACDDFTPMVERLAYKRFHYRDMPQAGEVVDVVAQELELLAPELVIDADALGGRGVLTHQLQARINSVIPRLIERIRALEARP